LTQGEGQGISLFLVFSAERDALSTDMTENSGQRVIVVIDTQVLEYWPNFG
jgi:hypothetical protein